MQDFIKIPSIEIISFAKKHASTPQQGIGVSFGEMILLYQSTQIMGKKTEIKVKYPTAAEQKFWDNKEKKFRWKKRMKALQNTNPSPT